MDERAQSSIRLRLTIKRCITVWSDVHSRARPSARGEGRIGGRKENIQQTEPAARRQANRLKGDVRFELLRERLLVEEEPGVPELLVEAVLEPPDALHRVAHVAVAREHEQRRVGAPREERVGVLRARLQRHIVLLWDGARGAPRELRRDVLEGRRAAIVFVREAKDRVQANLGWRRETCELANPLMDLLPGPFPPPQGTTGEELTITKSTSST